MSGISDFQGWDFQISGCSIFHQSWSQLFAVFPIPDGKVTQIHVWDFRDFQISCWRIFHQSWSQVFAVFPIPDGKVTQIHVWELKCKTYSPSVSTLSIVLGKTKCYIWRKCVILARKTQIFKICWFGISLYMIWCKILCWQRKRYIYISLLK